MSEKFYFAEQFLGRQTTPAGGGVDRLEAARSRMPAPVLITKSGDNMFLHDEHGRQVFTFEGWKENREAAKAWGDIAKEAFKHLATGFGQAAGDDLSAIPPNVIESALKAVDGWGDILKGVGRFGAKPFRTEEEEDEADYANYLELTNKFHNAYGVYKKDGEIVPHGTPGAEEVVKPQSYLGDFFRSLAGDGSSDFKKGAKALAGNADQVINPQWADSWSLVMDPVWLVPGGQLGKVQKILSSGGKPGRVLQALKSVKETAGKVPGASRAAEALGTMFSKPTTTTAGLAGRTATKIGKGGERLGAYVGEGWALKTLGGAGLGYGVYQYQGEDLIDLLVAGFAGVGSAKVLPKAIAKAGAATRVAGETVTAGVKGAEIGKLALGTTFAAGEYSEKTQKMLRLLDSTPLVNGAVRLSGEISNAMAKGSAFGAGMGYLVAGEEGAAAGMGIGVLGGPIGMGQGYAISKLASGNNRVQFRSKDQDGNIVIKEAESFLGIPEQDLIANFLGKLRESDKEAVQARLSTKWDSKAKEWVPREGGIDDSMLYGMALMDAYGMGLTRQGEGDLNIRYMFDDQIKATYEPMGFQWEGKEGVYHPNVDGKPLVVVNMSHAENPLRTLAHELFHPEWTTGRGEDDPLMMARAEIEGKLFGIKAADGSDAIPGMFSERQFRYLEANYLDRLFSDNPVGRADQENRPMQERRTLIMAEMLSEHFGNFAEAGKGDVVAHARKVLRRAGLDQEGEPSLLAKVFGMELTKYQTALLGRMREAFEYLGIKFDAAGNPTSSIFKDPRTAKSYRVNRDGSVEIRGAEGLMNAPEIDNLLAQYVLAKDRQLKRLGVSDKSIDDGAVVTAKEVLAQKDPTIVEQFKNSGMFQLDDEGNVKYMAGMPVLLTRKQRVERDLVVNEAIFKALDSVARAEHAGEGLIRKENAEGEVSYSGRYMSKEQLDALMALPDEVVPRFMKAKIRLLNENLAKGFDAAGNLTGNPALNFLISYYKATTGSRYTSKAKMSQQHASPYGWAITQAGNFNLQTFSIGRFESKINKWWKKAQGGNKRFANFFDLFGGDPDVFRGKVVEYLNNQVHGRRNPSGAQKDAIADFLNALPKAMKDLMPDRLSTDKEHVVPISLRVDRMEEINPTIGTAMPVHYDRLNVNFMPAGEPKLGGKEGSLVPKKDRVKTGHPPRVKPLEEAARRVDKMTDKEWAKEIEKHSPIRPVPDDRVPNKAELNLMDDLSKRFLNKTQQENFRSPVHGDDVKNAAIDITALELSSKAGTPVHPVAFKDSKGQGYAGYLVLDNAKFTYGSSERSLKIAQGMEKTRLAFVSGTVNTRNIPTRTELLRPNKAGERVWTQAGFNPTKHGYFFDKHNPSMKVIGGDRMLMAGNTVWVRNAKSQLGLTVKAVKTPGLMRMGEGPEVRYMPRGDSHALKIIKGTEKPEGLPKRPTILDLARYFQERVAEPIDFKKSTPDQEIKVEDSIYKETKHALKIHPEAKGWYDENLGLAMTVLRELDPDIAKPENDFTFKAMVAVTSDGNEVAGQFIQGWKTYEHWKDTGKIVGTYVSGDRIKNIRKNLKVIDKISRKLGPKEAAKWLTTKGTVSEMRQAAIRDLGFTKEEAGKLGTGENVGTVVPYASIFGPQLGSFFNNLYGDYSTVNMDRWFMRTMGRNTGTQVKDPTPKQWRDAKNRLRLAVDTLSASERKSIGITKASVKGGNALGTSKKMGGFFAEKKNRVAMGAEGKTPKNPRANEARLAANALIKMQKPLIEAPQGGGHRQWIRARIDAVQKRLKAEGVELENADLQALLWYNEKELYDAAGVRGPKGANDYASAAEALHAAVRGRPSKGYAKGTGRVGGIGRGKSSAKLGEPRVDFMPAGKDASPGWKLTTDLALDKIQKANPGMKSMKGPSMYNKLERLGALEEEVKWIEDLDTGEALDTWMKRQDKVTPQQVKDFIARNTIDVLERVYGGKDSEALLKAEERVEEAARDMHEANERGTLDESIRAEEEWREHKDDYEALLEREGTTYDKDDLVLPGAKEGSYRELVLRVPSTKRAPKVTVEEVKDFKYRARHKVRVEDGISNVGRLLREPYATRAEAEVAAAAIRKDPNRKVPTRKEFTSPHFKDDPNVILHLRINERVDADGKRMLFIEELQSDWAAKGRDKGYSDPAEIASGESAELAYLNSLNGLLEKYSYDSAEATGLSEHAYIKSRATPDEFARFKQLEDAYRREPYRLKDGIPAAPFVAKRTKEGTIEGSKKWKSLGMKRAIRWAAENGYDRLGWISGKDTAQRYNLRKHIETLEYDRLDKGFTRITAVDKDGNKLINDRRFPNENLDEAVGKEMADRILSQEKDMGEFSGMDLEVGGEGHIQMYDIDLPNMVNKYTKKKWGAKVGKVEMSLAELLADGKRRLGPGQPGGRTTAHYIDITPAMKESVMTEGQTMFMPAGKVAKGTKALPSRPTDGWLLPDGTSFLDATNSSHDLVAHDWAKKNSSHHIAKKISEEKRKRPGTKQEARGIDDIVRRPDAFKAGLVRIALEGDGVDRKIHVQGNLNQAQKKSLEMMAIKSGRSLYHDTDMGRGGLWYNDRSKAIYETPEKTRRDEKIKKQMQKMYPDEQWMPAGSDASYMKAAKKGDTKGAQLLVDKAAKAAGYKIGPVYHGTQRDFTTFDKGLGMTGKLSGHPIAKYGFFFAHEKSTAKVYAGKDGKVLDAHLKIGRLYKADMHGKEINRFADDRGVAVDTKVGPWIKG